MQDALASAGASPSDIAFINAHGTGTRENDRVESFFFHEVFPGVPFGSTKGYTGHTLGAAGAIEAAFTIASLERQEMPANRGFDAPDPELAGPSGRGAYRNPRHNGAFPDIGVRGQQQRVDFQHGERRMKACIRGAGVVGGFGCGLSSLEEAIRKQPRSRFGSRGIRFERRQRCRPGVHGENRPAGSVDPAQNPAPSGPLCPHGHSGQPSRP